MNIITERSFSYFLLNRQVRARSYLKETGTHFDSILFFKKYLWSSYYTIHSVLGVEVWWLTKKRYPPCWCEAYHLVGEERDIKHIITKKIHIHKLWNAPWRKSTGHYGREQGYLVKTLGPGKASWKKGPIHRDLRYGQELVRRSEKCTKSTPGNVNSKFKALRLESGLVILEETKQAIMVSSRVK